MNNYVLNCYEYDTNADTNLDQFLMRSETLDQVLLDMDGFVYRSLARLDNGRWLECIYWRSLVDAKRSEALMGLEVFMEFSAHIDNASVEIKRSEVLTQVFPTVAAA